MDMKKTLYKILAMFMLFLPFIVITLTLSIIYGPLEMLAGFGAFLLFFAFVCMCFYCYKYFFNKGND